MAVYNINTRFMAAEMIDAAPVTTASEAALDTINTARQQAQAEQMKTLKVKLDMSSILQALGPHKVMRFNPETQELSVVLQLSEQDNFPEPSAFSRSSAVIVWRQLPGKPVEVLLVSEAKVNRVSFVAGGQKYNESSLMGAIREVKEEVGLDLDIKSLQWLRSTEMGPLSLGELTTLNTFAVRVKDPEQPLRLQEEEVKEGGWYTEEEAVALMTIDSAKAAVRAFYAGKGLPVEFEEDYENDKFMTWGVKV